ncbi:MAG: AbrB/MazE/SpoVT family DNA-binding domain-containing protein [Rhodocyclaceae bacterium]
MRTKKCDLVPVDDSYGLVLPEEVLARLGLKEGDWVSLNETPQGFVFSPLRQESDDAASSSSE